MNDIELTITNKPNKTRQIRVEFDVIQLERLAANLGLFSPDFRRSLAAAEKDVRLGNTRIVASLRELAN